MASIKILSIMSYTQCKYSWHIIQWPSDCERHHTLTSLHKNSLMPPQHYLKGNTHTRKINIRLHTLLNALINVYLESKIINQVSRP